MTEPLLEYTHRPKRSHAQMQGSLSPDWDSDRFFNTYEPRNPSLNADVPSMPLSSPAPPLDSDDNPMPTSVSTSQPASFRYPTLSRSTLPAYIPSAVDTPYPPYSGGNSSQAHSARPSARQRSLGDTHNGRRRVANVNTATQTTPQRFVGDGFDFRRPVRAVQEQDVASFDLTVENDGIERTNTAVNGDQDIIDLTADDSGYGDDQDGNSAVLQGNGRDGQGRQSRNHPASGRGSHIPRGMDIIIDLDNGQEEWSIEGSQQAYPIAGPSSPDFEIISSRRISQPHQPSLMHSLSDGDEVEFIGANPLTLEEVERRRNQELDSVLDLLGNMNGHFVHLRAQVDRFNARINRTADRLRGRTPSRVQGRIIRRTPFRTPTFDFEQAAFDLGVPQEIPAPATPATPRYNPPPEAPEGFTRNPDKNDVLICPNCGDELCSGSDDIKRQVWIVKTCGHVYCGECAANRSAKRGAKGKERLTKTKTFKECQVQGCGKSVSNPKVMFQVFL